MKRLSISVLILMLVTLLGACNSNSSNPSDGKTVDVFYINSKTSSLAGESYKLIGTKTDDQINELLYMLEKTPDNMVYTNALTDKIETNFTFDESGCLLINFDSDYKELTGVEDVLCRAAIVKTLSQVEGVEYIQFSIDDQPLKDAGGDYIGPLTAEDFIDSTETGYNYNVKLYYANKDGDALIEYTTDINNTSTESIEELVINQLISGPTKEGMYSTIPEGTVLLNVSKTDGICTVDFNKDFLKKMTNVDEEISIYSIVNSLVELPDINKVQFTINSKSVKTYWEDVPLNGTFESNLNLIDKPE